MKIFIITFGDSQAGSTKYRFMQYLPFFKSQGAEIECEEKRFITSKSVEKMRSFDLIINQKSLLPLNISRNIRNLRKKLLFDFDDAIYTRPGKPYSWFTQFRINCRFNFWLKSSDLVMAANQFLIQHAKKYTTRTEKIPMTLDMHLWMPKQESHHSKIRLGWAGAPGNLHHLERLDSVLSSILQKFPHVTLSVYSGRKPILNCPYEFVPFQEGSEAQFIQNIDIGLLPLSNEEFSKRKSPIKAIQYLACGVPVVGNAWGATQEIVNRENGIIVESQNDWQTALQLLIEQPALIQKLGKAGRIHAEKNHSLLANQVKLWDLMQKVVYAN